MTDLVEETPAPLSLQSWEFVDQPPTALQVVELLATLPEVWGQKPVDYADYVQVLAQERRVRQPIPSNPSQSAEVHVLTHALYMTVAGRLKMLQAAQEELGWEVEVTPERKTPTKIPGYLSIETRLVFRTYVSIREGSRSLGSRFGTSWFPIDGDRSVAAKSPYEKVETSALGRALGAWGFGVLPGSGIASFEEVSGAQRNRAEALADARRPGHGTAANRVSRSELLEEAMALSERLRLARHRSEEEWTVKVGEYLSKTLGAKDAWDAEEKTLHWDKVKDGQLVILARSYAQSLQDHEAAAAAI